MSVIAMRQEPHEWLREWRKDKRIRQEDVEARTAEQGPSRKVSQSHLSKIERGRSPLIGLGPARMDALRQVLGISPSEWLKHTGIQLVLEVEEEPNRDARAQNRYPIPPELQEAIDLYGSRAPDLLDPVWQNYLAGFRNLGIEADTAEDWYDWYRELARRKVKPGEPN